jgi:hypothetical protein
MRRFQLLTHCLKFERQFQQQLQLLLAEVGSKGHAAPTQLLLKFSIAPILQKFIASSSSLTTALVAGHMKFVRQMIFRIRELEMPVHAAEVSQFGGLALADLKQLIGFDPWLLH